jgi:hypothetical protein
MGGCPTDVKSHEVLSTQRDAARQKFDDGWMDRPEKIMMDGMKRARARRWIFSRFSIIFSPLRHQNLGQFVVFYVLMCEIIPSESVCFLIDAKESDHALYGLR